MTWNIITIVGVGLIGGSIGKAVKVRRLARTVRGLGRNPANLQVAVAEKAIDEVHVDPRTGLAGADLVILCTPVDQIAAQALDYAQHATPGAIFTDAGSTKAMLVEKIEASIPTSVRFVGSHPIAGSEKQGVVHASADLFAGRLTVLTPTKKSDAGAVDRVESFWQSIGSRTQRMSPESHDKALAQTSHLPHLGASAIAGTLSLEYFDLAGTGFRDTTRIAAGDPALWSAIFLQNRDALRAGVAQLRELLAAYEHALNANDRDALEQLLSHAKKVRDALGN